MLVGSGLLAKACAKEFETRKDVFIYAAGVSNSACVDSTEFTRERDRLSASLHSGADVERFVYFGTCSVADPEAADLPYVRHKLAMEALVREHERYLILRLPQVAGRTPNPHTLLNFLHARISRSERFQLWRNARRNIIDVADVALISSRIISSSISANATYNVANPINYPMTEIVDVMERVIGKPAVYELADRGSDYQIDIRAMLRTGLEADAVFGDDYLEQIIEKYYPREIDLT